VRTYYEFFLKSFKKNFAYRADVWLRVFGNVLGILVQVAIWRAVLGSGSAEGVDLPDMVTYSILTTLVAGLLMMGLYHDADDRLRTGDIAVDLLKPLRYPLYLFADGLGRSAYQALFTVLPTLAVAWPLFGFSPPASPGHALAFLAALAIALSVSYALSYLIALLAFWFLTTMHFRFAVAGFVTAFSGSFLPLWFFPPGWAAVARALPFQYLGFVPAAAYMGEIPVPELGLTLAGGVAWTAALLALAGWLWSASVRRLVVQGG
jgi:ABC-2 type transport system permease protein